MRIIGNLLWWFFGGLEAAIGYFTGSLALACTIIGIPWGKQHFKMAGISLAPFGLDVELGFYNHKTMHKKFKYGIPAILMIQIALMTYLHMNL